LNARIGNAEIHDIVESFREPVTDTIGLKQRYFATCNNAKIVNSHYNTKMYRHILGQLTVPEYLETISLQTRIYRNYS
jgi:hypothetical protein